jgi:hypothetical protein
MAIARILTSSTWQNIECTVEFLSNFRDSNKIDPKLVVGINYTIILLSACYLEGALEDEFKKILSLKRGIIRTIKIDDFYTRKSFNLLFNALEEDLDDRISHTTGIENYKSVFKLLTDRDFTESQLLKSTMEGVSVLFQFRNVLAHGRKATAKLINAYWTDGNWEEYYFGGYKKAEDYLIKKGLLAKKYVDSETVKEYFTDNIANHFWQISKQFLAELKQFASQIDRENKEFGLHKKKKR